jgi:hypothetical protein
VFVEVIQRSLQVIACAPAVTKGDIAWWHSRVARDEADCDSPIWWLLANE